MKSRASTGVRRGPQTATIRFHDGTADRQAHSGALRLRGEESIKNPIRFFGRQAHASVADRDQDWTTLSHFGLDRKFTSRVLHGLDGVEHEVHQHLLELHSVSCDFGKIRREFRAHRDRIPGRLAPQQHEHFDDDFVYIDQLTFRRRLFVQRPQAVDDLGTSADIQDRKRAEEEREKLRADLAHMNRISILGELAASVSQCSLRLRSPHPQRVAPA